MTEQISKRHDQYGILRLVMCVMICAYHYNSLIGFSEIVTKSNYLSLDSKWIKEIAYGFLKVSALIGNELPICFFVLSGFLMHKGYHYRIREKRIKLGSFFAKRFIRLFPCLILSILIWSVGQWLHLYIYGEWWTGRSSSLWNTVIAATGIGEGTFFNILDTVNGPIWYISVLMVCYLFYFILTCYFDRFVLLGKRIGIRERIIVYLIYAIPFIVGFSIVTYGINLPFLNNLTAKGFIGFSVGVLLHEFIRQYYSKNGDLTPRGGRIIAIPIAVLGFYIVAFILYGIDKYKLFMGPADMYLGLLLFPMIILIIEYLSRKMPRIINHSINTLCGRLSFPLYLLHMPIYVWMIIIWKINHSGNPSVEFIYLIIVVEIIVCIFWCFVLEKPLKAIFLKMSNKIVED